MSLRRTSVALWASISLLGLVIVLFPILFHPWWAIDLSLVAFCVLVWLLPTAMKPLRSAIIIATLLYVADAFVVALPFFAMLLFAVVVFYFLPATLWALRSDRRRAKLRAAKAAIYLLAAVSTFVTLRLQNSMADRRAVNLGDACLAYRAKYHHYPEDLKALVPEFIPSVPVARYGLLGGDRFIYDSWQDDHEPMLWYEAAPPFGRRFYHMESRSWGYLD